VGAGWGQPGKGPLSGSGIETAFDGGLTYRRLLLGFRQEATGPRATPSRLLAIHCWRTG
jgi:hypothetical protein